MSPALLPSKFVPGPGTLGHRVAQIALKEGSVQETLVVALFQAPRGRRQGSGVYYCSRLPRSDVSSLLEVLCNVLPTLWDKGSSYAPLTKPGPPGYEQRVWRIGYEADPFPGSGTFRS